MTIGSAEKLNLSTLEFNFPESKIQALKQIKLTSKIVGQDRAISALEMGLGISAEGYNIFIMGAPGTGRRTVLSSLIKKYKPNINELQDIAYAFNFTRTNEPQALYFPAGEGKKFQREIRKTIDRIHKKVVRLVNSETFSAKQKKNCS